MLKLAVAITAFVALSNAYPQVLVPISLSHNSGIIRNARPLVGLETLLRDRTAVNDLNAQLLRSTLLNTPLGRDIVGDQLAIIQWSNPQNNNQVNRQLNTQSVVNQAVVSPGQVVGGNQESATNTQTQVLAVDEAKQNGNRVSQGGEQVNRESNVQVATGLANQQVEIEQINRDRNAQLNVSNGQGVVDVVQVERRADGNGEQSRLVERPILGVWPQVAWTTSPLGIITRRVL